MNKRCVVFTATYALHLTPENADQTLATSSPSAIASSKDISAESRAWSAFVRSIEAIAQANWHHQARHEGCSQDRGRLVYRLELNRMIKVREILIDDEAATGLDIFVRVIESK